MIKMKEIYTLDVEWDETEAWMICAYTNILFKFDTNNMKYKYVALLPENGIEYNNFHSRCVKYENRIYCLPSKGQDIYIYDTDLKVFRKIIVRSVNDGGLSFEKLCVREHILYAISYGLKQIFKIDMQEEKVISRHLIADGATLLNKAICYGNKIYVISNEQASLFEYDLDKEILKCIHLCDEKISKKGFTVVGVEGGQVWLCGYDNKVYMWDMMEGFISRYLELPNDIMFYDFSNNGKLYMDKGDNDYYFQECVFFENSIWFIPYQTNKLLYVKGHENIIRELYIEEETTSSLRRQFKRKYNVVRKVDEKYFVLKSFKNECYYKIDVENETIETKSIDVSYENLDELWKQYGEKNKIMSEMIAIDSNLYVNEIYRLSEQKKTEGEKEKAIGATIYGAVCR